VISLNSDSAPPPGKALESGLIPKWLPFDFLSQGAGIAKVQLLNVHTFLLTVGAIEEGEAQVLKLQAIFLIEDMTNLLL
jgi:hypothetical protein